MARVITVDPVIFKQWFPAFSDMTTEQINAAYAGAGSYIATVEGIIGLDVQSQTRGVYLATAHNLFMQTNPAAANGRVTSASEMDASASFNVPQTKNMLEYWLSLSPYGLELLALLATVQPPLPNTPWNIWPYYGGI